MLSNSTKLGPTRSNAILFTHFKPNQPDKCSGLAQLNPISPIHSNPIQLFPAPIRFDPTQSHASHINANFVDASSCKARRCLKWSWKLENAQSLSGALRKGVEGSEVLRITSSIYTPCGQRPNMCWIAPIGLCWIESYWDGLDCVELDKAELSSLELDWAGMNWILGWAVSFALGVIAWDWSSFTKLGSTGRQRGRFSQGSVQPRGRFNQGVGLDGWRGEGRLS